jgi:hypothetical protein
MIDSQQYIDRIRTSLPNPEYYEKLKRPDGLAASIHRSDIENYTVILTILNEYIIGEKLESRPRTGGDWTKCSDLPADFVGYAYRVVYEDTGDSHD